MFGVSYGTYLALTIMRDHPERLRSAILDATVPPSVVDLAEFWPNVRDGFQNIFRACTAQARCRSSFPNLERTFTKLVRRLESDPVRTTVTDPNSGQPTPVVLDGGALASSLVGMSFATPAFKDVPSWIAQLAAGDPQRLATVRLALVAPPGFVGYGLTYGVICSEWFPSTASGRCSPGDATCCRAIAARCWRSRRSSRTSSTTAGSGTCRRRPSPWASRP
jgi:pimeloyl-ACP methyl ester carboxylesterase